MSLYLAFDGGGTATRAGLYTAERALLAEATGPASNPVDAGVARCIATLAQLAREVKNGHAGRVEAAAAGISGAGKGGYAQQIAQALCEELGVERAIVTNDVRAVLFANLGAEPGIIVVAGTGSCVLAQDAEGALHTVGGHGTFFGDPGSAYQIAASVLRHATAVEDGLEPSSSLTEALMAAVQHGESPSLAAWAAQATKRAVAALAPLIAERAEAGDELAALIIEDQARQLAAQAAAALKMTDGGVFSQSSGSVRPVYVVGGVFEHCPRFMDAFRRCLAPFDPLFAPIQGHRAVLELALAEHPPAWAATYLREEDDASGVRCMHRLSAGSSSGTPALDLLDARAIVRVMNEQDATIPALVASQADNIAAVIEAVADALKRGGRLIYAGAGTSGRLGVLDASECPPTFGVPPERVLALIAGGERALRSSVEGAEDDTRQAEADLRGIDPPVSALDVVVGIAASGSTPYVHAALDAAHAAGARTALVCCNPAPTIQADHVIALDTSPEVLPGSTRLKAGTATKLALNTISTGAMSRAGYVFDGLMVGVRPINAKLRRRAIRIVAALTGLAEDRAQSALDAAEGRIPVAVLMVRRAVSADEAQARLNRTGGNLREALSLD